MVVNAAVEKNCQKVATNGIDILDYESNLSATEFVVNDIAGMEKLAELVNTETEDFSGKTVTLTADLKYDKTVERNHQAIGTYTYEFQGTFDGANHVISGINPYNEYDFLGVFGFVKNAKLKQIILEDSSITNTRAASIGGIAGGVTGNSVIEKCVVGGNVELTDYNTKYFAPFNGGIVGQIYNPDKGDKDVNIIINECVVKKGAKIIGGQTTGGIIADNNSSGSLKITRCINYATIKQDKNSLIAGGILGNGDDSQIERCINYGMIYVNGEKYANFTGGISGSVTKAIECCNMGQIISEGKMFNNKEDAYTMCGIGGFNITNCYNAGQLIAESDDLYDDDWNIRRLVGGIGDYSGASSESVQNCYSVGQIKNGWSGAITSMSENRGKKLSDCYWLTGSADVGVCESGLKPDSPKPDLSSVFEYSQSQMQAQAFVDELNANSKALGYGEVWAADTEHINNGYPILKNVPYKISDITNNPADDENNTNPDNPDEPLDTTPAPHFYEDHDYTTQATNSTIQIYANGGTVAVPGTTEKKNYKRCILYTDILPSYIYTAGKNGAIKPSSGKVVVGITASNQKPALVKGKIVDKSTSKIASASIKSGQITVTAKSQPGKVYLWAIDTGRAAASACIPVTVKGAPTTAYIYSIPDTDLSFAYGTTKQFKSGQVGIGESLKVYLYPAYKQNGVVQKAENIKYTASVAVKAADYFSVVQSGSNPYCFEIRAKGLKSGKSVAGAIIFTCNLNGKKAVFKATAINPVTNISTVNENGLTKSADNSFNIKASDTAKISGTFELQPVCASNTDATTDKLKIYAMGSANGYDTAKLEAGKVQITAKKTSAQGKVSLKPAKDKKTVTVTVAKGAKPATAYFLVVYNTINNGSKKGYTVISVTIE